MGKLIDLTGKRFGRLIVISKNDDSYVSPKYKTRYPRWNCVCDCGNFVICLGTSLRTGNSTSCGCYNKERVSMASFIDLTGQRFGRLVVIRQNGKEENGNIKWLCQCDCGNEKTVTGRNLRGGDTKSCGCYFIEKRKSGMFKLDFGQSSFNHLFSIYKNGARRRNLLFALSKEDFWQLIIKNCFYCGRKPYQKIVNKYGNGDLLYNGIDRLDSSIGYTKENVVPCCGRCNEAKNNISLSEFKDWIELVYNYFIKGEK